MGFAPKIGVTMRLETATRRFYLGRDYCEAVESFGAVPLHISLIPKKRYIEAAVADCDGLLLPGSDSDIDPYIFGEEPHPNLKSVVPVKDQTEALVLRAAERLGIPILAICYGMQALNVSRGGTLVQDIDSQVEQPLKHEQGIPLERNSHSIVFETDSRIANLKTGNKVRVNSHHHQSVKRIGANLRATARAKDGVIECIEDTRADRFVLGVQWHPEETLDDLRLFAGVVQAARARATDVDGAHQRATQRATHRVNA